MKPLPWSHIPCVKPPYSMPCLILILENDIENHNRYPVTPF